MLPWGIGSARQLRQQSGGTPQEFGARSDRVVDLVSTPIVVILAGVSFTIVVGWVLAAWIITLIWS